MKDGHKYTQILHVIHKGVFHSANSGFVIAVQQFYTGCVGLMRSLSVKKSVDRSGVDFIPVFPEANNFNYLSLYYIERKQVNR